MAQHIVLIENSETQVDMIRLIHAETGNRFQAGQKLMRYVRALMGGNKQAKVIVGVNAAKASATLTGTSVVATDAVIVSGVTLTAIASGATADQFNVGADDEETMANLAAAINAHEDLAGIVTADAAETVVTVSAARPGLMGNAITLVSSDATIVASAGRLAGGDDGAQERTHYYGSQEQA